jgi:hypothetical protein
VQTLELPALFVEGAEQTPDHNTNPDPAGMKPDPASTAMF